MTISRGISTTRFITEVQVQMVQDQSNQLLSTANDDFQRHKGNMGLEHNEITFTWIFFFYFVFFRRFPLTRISVSLYKNTYSWEKYQYKYTLKCKLSVFCFEYKNVQWLKLNEHMHVNMIKTIWHMCPAKKQQASL